MMLDRRQAVLIYNKLVNGSDYDVTYALLELCDAPTDVSDVDTIEGMALDPTADRVRAANFLRRLADALDPFVPETLDHPFEGR